jgi:hypothetical protein
MMGLWLLCTAQVADGGYQYVNSSIKQFIELAWRFHHINPVRYWIAERWDELGPEPDEQVVKMVWKKAKEVDPMIDTDVAVSFWPARIFGLL